MCVVATIIDVKKSMWDQRPLHYVIRFDDICPTMNWDMWERIERILGESDIKPIVSIVPDNRDSFLNVGPPVCDFWERVRGWQSNGWAIGLHGFQHRYVTNHSGVMRLNRRSEFAGLAEEAQRKKVSEAVRILANEGVRPDIWVAPAHSFDRVTLRALKDFGISIISDGFFPFPHRDREGILWVPQQLWSFRWRPFGVWTVCIHHNSWSRVDLEKFAAGVRRYGRWIDRLDKVVGKYGQRQSDCLDLLFSHCYRGGAKAKWLLKQVYMLPRKVRVRSSLRRY